MQSNAYARAKMLTRRLHSCFAEALQVGSESVGDAHRSAGEAQGRMTFLWRNRELSDL